MNRFSLAFISALFAATPLAAADISEMAMLSRAPTDSEIKKGLDTLSDYYKDKNRESYVLAGSIIDDVVACPTPYHILRRKKNEEHGCFTIDGELNYVILLDSETIRQMFANIDHTGNGFIKVNMLDAARGRLMSVWIEDKNIAVLSKHTHFALPLLVMSPDAALPQ